jgi:hypothetical protein
MTKSTPRKNGWQVARGLAPDPIPDPPEFDLLLARVGLGPKEPAAQVAKNPVVQQWARSWYRSKYIPEDVLAELGLTLDAG